MFDQVMVDLRDRETLRFVWRSNIDEKFQDIQKNVHLFEKFDSPCHRIWALNKTASDNIVKIVSCAEEAITDSFQVGIQRPANHKVLTISKTPSTLFNLNFDGISIERALGIS